MGYQTHLGPSRFGTVKEGASVNCGSPVLVQTATIAFSDTVKNLFLIPAGALVLSVDVAITTAFNAGTNDFLSIGSTADDDLFVNDMDLGTLGVGLTTGVMVAAYLTAPLTVGTADLQVTGTYTQTGGAATTGAATIIMYYVMRNTDGTTTIAP